MKYEEQKQSLIRLLQTHSGEAYAEVCIKALENDRLVREYVGLNSRPMEEVRDVFTKRARREPDDVDGLQNLVSNLNESDSPRVCFSSIKDGEYDYHIFTDERYETLFGIVAFDKWTRAKEWGLEPDDLRRSNFLSRRG